MRYDTKLTIQIPKNMSQRLKSASNDEEMTVSECIRWALREWLGSRE